MLEGLIFCNFFLLNKGVERSLPMDQYWSVGIYLWEYERKRQLNESEVDDIYESLSVERNIYQLEVMAVKGS